MEQNIYRPPCSPQKSGEAPQKQEGVILGSGSGDLHSKSLFVIRRNQLGGGPGLKYSSGILAHSSLANLCILEQSFRGAVDLWILWGDKLEAEHMESVKTAKIS